jgi:NADH-quinone oxidoreductase subunit G
VPAISSTPTIEGIEKADAVADHRCNPRIEASVLNARIRKRWRMGISRSLVIGEQAELRYDYEYLGAG